MDKSCGVEEYHIKQLSLPLQNVLIDSYYALCAYPLYRPCQLVFHITADHCILKLKKEFKVNETYFDDVKKRVEGNDISGAYDAVYAKAAEMCTVEQVERMKALEKKYVTLKQAVQALAPEYNKQTKDQVLQWLRDDNLMALSGFLVKEGMANMHNATRKSQLMQISLPLSSMQYEQILNPI